ncbi:MAG: DUF58 domain-containing protein [Planctomycetota bacterium]
MAADESITRVECDAAAVRAQLERFAWLPPTRPVAGAPGERLARGTGSSLEFADRREYMAGDDVRHLDWGAYARTDQWMVRVYAREVSPRLDVLLDLSASMAVTEGDDGRPAKAGAALDLARFALESGRAAGLSVQLVALGEQPRRVPADELEQSGLSFDARRPLPDLLRECGSLLRAGSQRLLISDLLVEQPPDRWLRVLGQGAGRLEVLQLLTAAERAPEVGGAWRLEDVESGASRDLVMDRSVVAAYLERLGGLTSGLRDAARRLGASFLELTADDGLERHLTEALLPAQLVAPAAG